MTESLPPKVTVVMPAKNAEQTILQSIESVTRQDFSDWELIVVDDASTDHTRRLVEQSAQRDSRIRIIVHQRPKGAGPSRIEAIREAQGSIIAFLDADDVWLPTKLSEGLGFMESHGASWIHSSFRTIRPSGKVGVKNRSRILKSPKQLLRRNFVTNSTVMIRKALIPINFRFTFSFAQDMELWLRITQDGHQCMYLDEDSTLYRLSRQSLSGNKVFAAKRQWRNLGKIEQRRLKRLLKFAYYGAAGTLSFLKKRVPSFRNSDENDFLRELNTFAKRLKESAPAPRKR